MELARRKATSLSRRSGGLRALRALECAGVCLSWAQIWAQSQIRKFLMTGNLLKRMVGRDGIEPPTPGFSVLCSTN
jgi:hypothetical protein